MTSALSSAAEAKHGGDGATHQPDDVDEIVGADDAGGDVQSGHLII